MKQILCKKMYIKIIALALVATTIIGIAWNENFIKSNAQKNANKNISDAQETHSFEESEKITIISSENEILSDGTIKTTTVKSDGTEIIALSNSTSAIITTYDSEKNIINEEVIDINSLFNTISTASKAEKEYLNHNKKNITRNNTLINEINWYPERNTTLWGLGKKESAAIWYISGTKDEASYLEIGSYNESEPCYLINYTNLNSEEKANCDAFMKAVNDSRFNTTIFMCSATSFSTFALAFIISAVGSGFDVATITDKLGGLFGLGGASVPALIVSIKAAYTNYKEAKNYYKIIKDYGIIAPNVELELS